MPNIPRPRRKSLFRSFILSTWSKRNPCIIQGLPGQNIKQEILQCNQMAQVTNIFSLFVKNPGKMSVKPGLVLA